MGTLESQEVLGAFGKVVQCAVERGRSQAMEELYEAKALNVADSCLFVVLSVFPKKYRLKYVPRVVLPTNR